MSDLFPTQVEAIDPRRALVWPLGTRNRHSNSNTPAAKHSCHSCHHCGGQSIHPDSLKQRVSDPGMVHYWRTTGNGDDFCMVRGDYGFECH